MRERAVRHVDKAKVKREIKGWSITILAVLVVRDVSVTPAPAAPQRQS